MADPLLDELVEATEKLKADPFWLALLTENLAWASCEGFFQSSILGAFNQTSQRYIADREKKFVVQEERAAPDLLLFERSNYAAWWRGRRTAKGAGLIDLCLALVETKLVWTEGNAYGSYVLSERSGAVAGDALKLAKVCPTLPDCRGYLAVLISGLHPPGIGGRFLNQARETVQEKLARTGLVREYRQVGLLDGGTLPHWETLDRGDPPDGMWAECLWVCLGHCQGQATD
jgi:hypothetical protein